MGLLDNIDNVAFATAYDNDKVLEVFTGSFPAVALASNTVTIPHTWGEHVLPVMIFSVDNATWLDAGSATYTPSTVSVKLSASCSVSPTQITVSAANNVGPNETVYYKIALIAED